jgi:O-methyltransferase
MSSDEKQPDFFPEDISDKYHFQLYYHLASKIDLKGKRILEVGCGRGGGCYYLMKYLQPEKCYGIDISQENIKWAKKNYIINGLIFLQGNAESLPFQSQTFDVVVNIESSHLYPNREKFYEDVLRVLHPNGYFLYADICESKQMSNLKEQLNQVGFRIIFFKDITKNVAESLRLGNDRRKAIICSFASNSAQFKRYSNWAKLIGTDGYKDFFIGQGKYWSGILQKP